MGCLLEGENDSSFLSEVNTKQFPPFLTEGGTHCKTRIFSMETFDVDWFKQQCLEEFMSTFIDEIFKRESIENPDD